MGSHWNLYELSSGGHWHESCTCCAFGRGKPACCNISTACMQICYPKQSKKPLFEGLVTQCKSLKLPFVDVEKLPQSQLSQAYDVIIDAMFGFSFRGDPRPPFDQLLHLVVHQAAGCYVVAVDIPSGWDVEQGPPEDNAMQPDMLVSLTAPKKGCASFQVCWKTHKRAC